MKFPFVDGHPSSADWDGAAPGGAQRAERPGLVTSQTSGTACSLIEVNPVKTRLNRVRRGVITAARMHEHELRHKRWRPAMLTLTYRDVGGWGPKHVSHLLRLIRQWLRRRGHVLRYVWVAELQQRGALHYHVLVWLPRGLTLPKPDKQGWWPHGSTRIEWARKAAGYLAKYASKLESKSGISSPQGARLFARGGFEDFGRTVIQWFNLPQWARQVCDLAGRAVRVKGVGLVDRETGVCLPSPWRLSRRAGTTYVERAWNYVNALRDVDGPFSWLPDAVRP